jgi:hypothetical protein
LEKQMNGGFDPYHKWLGIPPGDRPPDHYRLLGLAAFESDADVVAAAADRQMAHVRTYQSGPHADVSQQLLNELAAARLCLLSPDRRLTYDTALRRKSRPAPPPAVLAQAPPMPAQTLVAPLPTAASAPLAALAPPAAPLLAAAIPVAAPAPPYSSPTLVPAAVPTAFAPGSDACLPPPIDRQAAPAGRPRASRQRLPLGVKIAGHVAFALMGLAIGLVILKTLKSRRPSANLGDQTAIEPVATPVPFGGEEIAADDDDSRDRRDLEEVPVADVTTHDEPPLRNDDYPDTSSAAPSEPETEAEAPANASSATEPARLPAPSTSALEASRLAVRRRLAEDFERAASGRSAQEALARKLLDEARGNVADADQRYALFDLAMEQAIEAQHLPLANEAIDELAARFEVDALSRRVAATHAVARHAEAPEHHRTVAGWWVSLLDDAIAEDRYDDALEIGDRAITAARETFDDVLQRQLNLGQAELRELPVAFAEAAPLRDRWRQNAADTEAAAAWGRFCCLYKNDWEAGLPLWALDDGPAGDAAALDLTTPTEPAEQLALADAWWELSEQQTHALPRRLLRWRADTWYQRASADPGAVTSQIAARRIAYQQSVSPVPMNQWIEILGTATIVEDDDGVAEVLGQWERRRVEIRTQAAQGDARIALPLQPTGSYDLQVRFTLHEGNELLLALPVGEGDCLVGIGCYGGVWSGIERIDGAPIHANASGVRGGPIAVGVHSAEIRIDVDGEQATIDVKLDGDRTFRWTGQTASLSNYEAWQGMGRLLRLGANQQHITFHSLRLRPRTGFCRWVVSR